MPGSIKLGHIFGIEIGLHYSWFVIAALICFSLATHFAFTHPGWSTAIIWSLAATTAILFFVTLLIHELSHTLVARAYGMPVKSITLFALGGVANIEKEASRPQAEFWMGIVGPITSAVLGLACLLVAVGLGWPPLGAPASPLVAGLVWLGYINLVLAAFNMIPGFPLDGGRVLRAAIWGITNNVDRATRLAARIGQVVALGFIVWGIMQFLVAGSLGGLWLALIGWFLSDAAQATYAQAEVTSGLKGIRTVDAMSKDWDSVSADMDLQSFVEAKLLKTWRRCFIVTDTSGRMAGLITPHEVKGLSRDSWGTMTVGQAMRPLDQLRTVAPETPVTEALELMIRQDINQVPVLSEGKLVGMLNRSDVMQLLQTRSDLGY